MSQKAISYHAFQTVFEFAIALSIREEKSVNIIKFRENFVFLVRVGWSLSTLHWGIW